MPFRAEIIFFECIPPPKHRDILVIHQMPICPVFVRGIEGVVAQHIKSLFWQIALHDFVDISVVAEGQMNLVESTVRFVDAVFGRVHRMMQIGIRSEIFREDDVFGKCTTYRERIADHSPLRLAPQAQYLAKVMNKSCQHEPARMSVCANRLRGLEQMFNLGEVRIGIAIIHKSVEKLRGFPDGLLSLFQRKVLGLFSEDIVEGLMLMVQAVEVRDAGICFFVVLPELLLRLSFPISTLEKLVPLFHVGPKRAILLRCNRTCHFYLLRTIRSKRPVCAKDRTIRRKMLPAPAISLES